MSKIKNAAAAIFIHALYALPACGAAAVPAYAPGAAGVEERLRADPLMMPYYTGRILPSPQKAEYLDAFLPMSRVALVVGNDVENPAPLLDLLKDRIARYGGAAETVSAPGADAVSVISLGDTEIARQVKGLPAVPAREQGYILQCAEAGGKPLIILKGRDRLGLVWAISSLNQLIHWKDGRTAARAARVEDYPRGLKRGYITGVGGFFYSPSWLTWGSRSRDTNMPDTAFLLAKERSFTVMCKFNANVYQQVIPAGHGDRENPGDGYWRMPEKWDGSGCRLSVIDDIGRSLSPLGITWYGCVHPQVGAPEYKICADEESLGALLVYARRMEAAGGHLDIQLDDVRFPLNPYDKEKFGSAREADTWIVTNLMARLKKDYPGARLLVCPPFYWGPGGSGWRSYGEDRDAYLRAIGDRWPMEADVFWTGQRVNGTPLATRDEVKWVTGLIRRKPWLWQNSAVTWYRAYFYHYGAEPINTLKDLYWDGFLESIGWYGFNSDFPVRCIANAVSADFQWNPDAYDPGESVREAASKFIGPAAWKPLEKFSDTLSYFDRFASSKNYGWMIGGPFHNNQNEMRQYAARNIDVLEARIAEAEALYNELLALNKAAIDHWTGCAHFLNVARSVVTRTRNGKDLAVFRKAPAQRAVAQKAGDYSAADNDYFLAASNFKKGLLCDVTNAVSAGEAPAGAAHPACVLTAAKPEAEAGQWLWKNDLADRFELRVSASKGAGAGNAVITLNGRELHNAPTPFGAGAPSSIALPIPDGVLKEKDNLLNIRVSVKGDTQPDGKAGKAVLMAIQYAVFKRIAGGKAAK